MSMREANDALPDDFARRCDAVRLVAEYLMANDEYLTRDGAYQAAATLVATPDLKRLEMQLTLIQGHLNRI